MATVTITHATLTNAAADTTALVDGPKWDASHTVTGLENVDNTSDANKPVSTATQTALDLKANIASPTFTGTAKFAGAAVGAGASYGVPSDAAFVVNMTGAALTPFNNGPTEIFTAQFAATVGAAGLPVSVGTGSWGGWGFVRRNGAAGALTKVLSGDVLGTISGRGYVEGSTNALSRAVANMSYVATQDFTDTGQGTRIDFYATINGNIGGAQSRIFSLYGSNAVIGARGAVASGTVPFLDLNYSAAATPFPGSTVPGLRVLGLDGSTSAIAFQNYGGSIATQSYLAGGTAAAPTATPSGSVFYNFQGFGWDGVEWGSGGVQTPPIALQLKTAEAHVPGAHGTLFDIFTTPIGSIVRALAARIQPSGGVSVGTTTDYGLGNIAASGGYSSSVSTTKTANYTMTVADSSLIFNGAGSLTFTLLSAATYPGRWIRLKTTAAQTVVSATSNVVPLTGGAAGTAILAATAGKWADLQSDGTNWVIMAGN